VYFSGYTIQNSSGHWKGNKEKSLIITIETEADHTVTMLAKVLKGALKQESIGFVKTQDTMEFI